MKNNRLFLIAICLVLVASLLCGCPGGNTPINTTTSTTTTVKNTSSSVDTNINDDDINSDYDESDAKKITFSGDSVTVKGKGAAAQGSTVRISAEGTYVVSGSSNDGYIIIEAAKSDVKLVLDGLNLTHADGPAILVKDAKKVTFTLADGTNNVLSDGSSYSLYEGNAIVDGAIFAKADLVFNGNGTLTVNGNNAHGIVSKDALTITGGNIIVNSKNAGICGKDFLKVTNANITIKAGTDGLKSDNLDDASAGYIYIQSGSFNINSANDAIQATNSVNIDGGTFNIKTTSTASTASAKGVKGVAAVEISGGTFVIDSADDSIHSDGDVLIAGGDISLKSADDGIHANDNLSITGGSIVIEKSYEGLEATDIAISNGKVIINATDDGMNASGGNDENTTTGGRPGDMFESTTGSITISGGYVIVRAEGDGIDANGSLTISGGVVLVDGPSRGGNGSLDYNSTASISGGVFVALGTSDMAQNFKEATQGSILTTNSSTFSAGTVISVCDANGNVIVAFTSTKTFNCVTVSAPELKQGETYTFYKNASVSGLDENGFAHNTTQSGGTSWKTVTLNSLISGQGSSMPGGGGVPGGTRPR